MAALQGGPYLTFGKPYLGKVADVINSGKELKMAKAANGAHKINKTDEVKAFLKAVKDGNQRAVEKAVKEGTKYMPIFNGYKWTDIDKGQFTGLGGAPSAESTAKQEVASMFAIQKSIENNGYTDKNKFYKLYRKDLLKIYPEMDEEWEDTFFEQQKTTQKEVGNTKYNHYSRDDGFMDYITKLVKTMYGISQKDTWNPADIWLVANYDKAKRKLDNAIKDDTTSIKEFNAILRQMFHDREIVGISLKKMSGKTARWELVNLEKDDLFDNDEYNFKYVSCVMNLSLKSKTEFTNTESKLTMASKKQNIFFTIRQGGTGFQNLKIEGTDIGASSARLGKAPLDMVSTLFSEFGLEDKRWRSWRNYPKDVSEYLDREKEFIAMYKKLKATGKVDMSIKDEKEFSKNMIAVFSDKKAEIAMSKLMQMDVLNEIFSLRQKKKLEDMLTSLSFLAQKKGTVFGPFAKLY